ncbi:UNVERIFIED_CONTAM: hypothetical protein Sradi_1926100 [Sesamum radiatum]|uniref:DNA-directed RNA polymerase II subunit RPB9-like zinc ribbon domain-containing protein n=1 Tax=Sesamum radiatum TaxID=300843 RepID=A0AAW2TDH3_SESRA
MEFCPTCGNMLLYELPHMERPARFYCPTCPYVCQIESKVKIKRHLRLVKKPIDPIFSEDDRKNLNKTTGVSCPDCNHGEASFTQVQTSCYLYMADDYYPSCPLSHSSYFGKFVAGISACRLMTFPLYAFKFSPCPTAY